jgi:hypothetical protein
VGISALSAASEIVSRRKRVAAAGSLAVPCPAATEARPLARCCGGGVGEGARPLHVQDAGMTAEPPALRPRLLSTRHGGARSLRHNEKGDRCLDRKRERGRVRRVAGLSLCSSMPGVGRRTCARDRPSKASHQIDQPECPTQTMSSACQNRLQHNRRRRTAARRPLAITWAAG